MILIIEPTRQSITFTCIAMATLDSIADPLRSNGSSNIELTGMKQ